MRELGLRQGNSYNKSEDLNQGGEGGDEGKKVAGLTDLGAGQGSTGLLGWRF